MDLYEDELAVQSDDLDTKIVLLNEKRYHCLVARSLYCVVCLTEQCASTERPTSQLSGCIGQVSHDYGYVSFWGMSSQFSVLWLSWLC